MALWTLTTVGLLYFIMREGPTWIEIHWNSIWLRARWHMTSHYTWGSVTTLHDFGGVLGRHFGHFLLGSHNLMCEVVPVTAVVSRPIQPLSSFFKILVSFPNASRVQIGFSPQWFCLSNFLHFMLSFYLYQTKRVNAMSHWGSQTLKKIVNIEYK